MSDKEIVNSNETPILKDVVKGAFGSSTSAGDTSGFGGQPGKYISTGTT